LPMKLNKASLLRAIPGGPLCGTQSLIIAFHSDA
jgi:hypothetical protein